MRRVLPTPIGSGEVSSSLSTLSSQCGRLRASADEREDLVARASDHDLRAFGEHARTLTRLHPPDRLEETP